MTNNRRRKRVFVLRHQFVIVHSCFVIQRLQNPGPATMFPLRQGLWIEDLQTPPGQECSNGSMILLAVVLRRAFFEWLKNAENRRFTRFGRSRPRIAISSRKSGTTV